MAVYVLLCEDETYYIGHTLDLERRIAQHFLGRGSGWTMLHPPLRVLDIYPQGSRELENAVTISLMCQHGYRNVRGGSWVSVEIKSIPLPISRAYAIRPPHAGFKRTENNAENLRRRMRTENCNNKQVDEDATIRDELANGKHVGDEDPLALSATR